MQTNLFSAFPDVTRFQFRIQMTVQAGSASEEIGSAFIDVIVNRPPSGGNCSITPDRVASPQTPFFITCRDWTDDIAVDRFEIYGENAVLPVLLC